MYTAVFRILSLSTVLFASACGGGGGSGSSAGTANAPPVATAVTSAPAAPAPEVQAEAAPPATEIKLLALYSPGVAEQFNSPDLRISHLVNVANDVVTNSGVELSFSLAHIEWVDYPDFTAAPQALDDLTFANHSAFDAVEAAPPATDIKLLALYNHGDAEQCNSQVKR